MSAVRRVYLPLTVAQLRVLHSERLLSGIELTGFAVTPALAQQLPSGEDDEGLEYAALQEAAQAAAVQGVRVVVAADIDDLQIEPAGDDVSLARVVVRDGLPLRRAVSLQVLDPTDERDEVSDLDLSWYDVTELAALLGDLDDVWPRGYSERRGTEVVGAFDVRTGRRRSGDARTGRAEVSDRAAPLCPRKPGTLFPQECPRQ